jgi:hypothetical protein
MFEILLLVRNSASRSKLDAKGNGPHIYLLGSLSEALLRGEYPWWISTSSRSCTWCRTRCLFVFHKLLKHNSLLLIDKAENSGKRQKNLDRYIRHLINFPSLNWTQTSLRISKHSSRKFLLWFTFIDNSLIQPDDHAQFLCFNVPHQLAVPILYDKVTCHYNSSRGRLTTFCMLPICMRFGFSPSATFHRLWIQSGREHRFIFLSSSDGMT